MNFSDIGDALIASLKDRHPGSPRCAWVPVRREARSYYVRVCHIASRLVSRISGSFRVRYRSILPSIKESLKGSCVTGFTSTASTLPGWDFSKLELCDVSRKCLPHVLKAKHGLAKQIILQALRLQTCSGFHKRGKQTSACKEQSWRYICIQELWRWPPGLHGRYTFADALTRKADLVPKHLDIGIHIHVNIRIAI